MLQKHQIATKNENVDMEDNEERKNANPSVTRAESGKSIVKDESPLQLTDLLTDMYYKGRKLDPNSVSLQSSFICMLHLANEKGLQFGQEK